MTTTTKVPSPKVVLLSKIQARLNQRTFSKEDSAWTEAAIRSAELLSETEFPHGVDPFSDHVTALFQGGDAGSLSERLHLRQGGAAVQLRTYIPLNEGTSTAGGDLVPIGFYGQVWEALKKYDGLFDAGRRIYTKAGGVCNLPSADDTSVAAVKVTENAPVSQTNPTFGNAQFGLCPLWSTQQILISRQLLTDSGIDLSSWFAKIFAVRLARGIGAQFISTLLGSSVPTGVTTASPTAIAATEVLKLIAACDPAYANSPRAGWL